MFLHAVKKPTGEARAGTTRAESASPEQKADSPRVPPFGSNTASYTTGNRTRVSPLVLTKMPFPQFLHVAGTYP